MMAKLLARSIRALCVGSAVLGMTTAMAQDTSGSLQHAMAVNGEHLVVVAYSDPEGEVTNGTDPPCALPVIPTPTTTPICGWNPTIFLRVKLVTAPFPLI